MKNNQKTSPVTFILYILLLIDYINVKAGFYCCIFLGGAHYGLQLMIILIID